MPCSISQYLMYSHCMLTIADHYETISRIGKALADPTRAKILVMLMKEPSCPSQIAQEIGTGRTNVSNHLACLRGCGIVVASPKGRKTMYSIADQHLSKAIRQLLEVSIVLNDDGCVFDEVLNDEAKVVA